MLVQQQIVIISSVAEDILPGNKLFVIKFRYTVRREGGREGGRRLEVAFPTANQGIKLRMPCMRCMHMQ